jgi:hypothetical protein
MNTLEKFIAAYIEAIYFTDTGDDRQPPEDAELSPEALKEINEDCADFLQSCDELIRQTDNTYDSAAHDFWFTRNGHGVGFWDGDWPEPQASDLDAAAKAYGEVWVYQGDDGLIYFGR